MRKHVMHFPLEQNSILQWTGRSKSFPTQLELVWYASQIGLATNSCPRSHSSLPEYQSPNLYIIGEIHYAKYAKFTLSNPNIYGYWRRNSKFQVPSHIPHGTDYTIPPSEQLETKYISIKVIPKTLKIFYPKSITEICMVQSQYLWLSKTKSQISSPRSYSP